MAHGVKLSAIVRNGVRTKAPGNRGFPFVPANTRERRRPEIVRLVVRGDGGDMHTEQERFVVYVLWLKGHTLKTIAYVTKKREKQLAGMVTRSPWPNRSALTWEQRQLALDQLKAIRFDGGTGRPLDGGMLDRIDWTILPLQREQVRG